MALVSKEGASIYVCHADSISQQFRRAMKDGGWSIRQCLIWVKNTFVMGRQDYQWQHEPILYGWKEGKAHSWYGGRKQGTVWLIDKPVRNGVHPTMKPIAVCAKAIQNSSKPDEVVLDAFGGSGSTLIACEEIGRKCYSIEYDPVYCDVIIKRWEEHTEKRAKKITA